MIVVSNSSPIIALATIERLDLLESIFQEIRIPVAVYNEIVVHGKNEPGAQQVSESDWIITKSVADKQAVATLRSSDHLGLGEAEVIVLADQRQQTGCYWTTYRRGAQQSKKRSSSSARLAFC